MKPENNSPESLDLRKRYMDLDYRCGLQSDRLWSNRDYEMNLFLPTQDAKEHEHKELENLLHEAYLMPAPDPVFALLRSHIIDFIEGQRSNLDGVYQYPSTFISSLTNFLTFLGNQDSRPPQARLEILLARVDLLDALWSALRSILETSSRPQLVEASSACSLLARVASIEKSKAQRMYQGLSGSDMEKTIAALDAFETRGHGWAQEIGVLLENRSDDKDKGDIVTVGPERYRSVLETELGVSLDELLDWYEEEVEKTRSEFVETAANLNLPGHTVKGPLDAVEIMNKYAGPADSPSEMFERMERYLARAKKACRDWVNMPEEDCRVVPVYEQCRETYPWGGYGGGCPRRRPLLGEVFLNDTNYKAVTDGWIKINAVHECYPGHHVQWVRTTLDPLPETMKLGAKRVPMEEGMCHRTERLMEYIYDDDPFYPLAVAYRRHHTSVRIKADLYMQYFGRPLEDAIKLYMDELGFDYQTARGQAVSQLPQNRIGYFTCYYYGMKKLEDMESRYGYDRRTFTEYLFSLPYVSLSNFEAFLTLSDHDKERLLTQFPSNLEYK
ncbi:MAG: DUF885 family protein [Firmicutes bacterium]|nr:DUF885 family protein [Candidatus Fermentithermobacillaceae bacterium]